MLGRARWVLKTLGWVLVACGVAPYYHVKHGGPAQEHVREFSLGLTFSPVFRHATVVTPGNASASESTHTTTSFEVRSWSGLALLAGAVLVSGTNRRKT